MRAYVEQTSGWDDAEQHITADKEFADLPFAVVEEIALLPDAQGRGIGSHLLRGILRAAQRRDVPVRLSVFVNNPAQALYIRLGFEVVRIENPRMSMRWAPDNT
ncbi:GNAT family N-acetyltransferase [Frankia sp. AgPm24]|uniref:GNAT family N-acetyltransferase n=1 Tax=Frankia sp. AgPm24 TaxID=631128 RepID=UPI0035AE311C